MNHSKYGKDVYKVVDGYGLETATRAGWQVAEILTGGDGTVETTVNVPIVNRDSNGSQWASMQPVMVSMPKNGPVFLMVLDAESVLADAERRLSEANESVRTATKAREEAEKAVSRADQASASAQNELIGMRASLITEGTLRRKLSADIQKLTTAIGSVRTKEILDMSDGSR